jgi:chromosome segregation ATPase
MDDLTELQSRVAAAQERLQQSAEEERRYGLRLNDIVSIVEGSLSRQRDEVEKQKAEIVDLRTTLGKLSSERDEAKGALIQAHTALSAAQARLGQREVQNEQLRRMLMELLGAIEGRKGHSVQDTVRRLEGGIQTLMKQEHTETAEIAAAAPEASPARPSMAAAPARGRLTVVATVTKANEIAGQLALATQPASEEAQEPLTAESEPESLSDVAMNEAGKIVTEPDAEAPKTDGAHAPREQDLVNALLDAERKLIEAEALGGAANANSPVAEIIRRISQRTREINEQAPQS